MSGYTRQQFGQTVVNDFERRRGRDQLFERTLLAGASLATRALGHPDFEDLAIGERRTADMVAVFLDLSNFTRRTFWDDQDETVDLAQAVLTGFIEIVGHFGGHPLGLRGDGLFAGFSPGQRDTTAALALAACDFALDGVDKEVNPWLEARGFERVQARAGGDFGQTTFVRIGSRERSEVNPVGFAANFAAKCEKAAKAWEIVVGEGLVDLFPREAANLFVHHASSPKTYSRGSQTRTYRFYDYRWHHAVPHLAAVTEQLDGNPASSLMVQ